MAIGHSPKLLNCSSADLPPLPSQQPTQSREAQSPILLRLEASLSAMAPSDDVPSYVPGDDLYNSKLYKALTHGDSERVVELCREVPEGPLHVVSIQNVTVLHMASHSMQHELVLELLKMVHLDQLKQMTHQNEKGNTILHEAAAFNKLVPAARIMLEMAPNLLSMQNKSQETALYRAARYGRQNMFEFLNDAAKEKFQTSGEIFKMFYQKEDKSSSILHATVSAEQFGLAHLITCKYDNLVVQRDNYGRTALLLLASNSSAFQSRPRSYLRQFMCLFSTNTEVALGWIVPWWEATKKEKRKYESALTLADLLISKDISWKETNPVQEVEEKRTSLPTSKQKETNPIEEVEGNGNSSSTSKQIYEASLFSSTNKSRSIDIVEKKLENYPNPVEEVDGKGNSSSTNEQIYESPLFCATKSGCIDIVKKILDKYPQAVEHVDNNGWNILHVAIKYRQMEVFDMVERMTYPMRRLIHKLDNKSNSILHMVGEKEEKNVLEWKMQSPAFKLQENLLLFERVKEICPKSFLRHENSDHRTAEELFALNNKKLRKDAKEWLKTTAQNFSAVVVLIATVVFAAAYTVPGGSDQKTGQPIVLHELFFIIFTITDVLCLTFTLTSIIVFLKFLTSPFRRKDFKESLPHKLLLGVTLMIFSVSMMMLAFAATIVLLISHRQQWSKVVLCSVAFLPVSVFALSYTRLYFSLTETVMHSLRKIGAFVPRYESESRNINISNSSREIEI